MVQGERKNSRWARP